jgi:hypothetical protein
MTRIALVAGAFLAGAAIGAATLPDPAAAVQVSDPARQTLAPEVAVGRDGSVHVIWLDKNPQPIAMATQHPDEAPRQAPGPVDRHLSSMDLWFARSTDGGASFGRAVRVNDQAGMVWGFAISKPRIALGRSGTIHIIFPANAVGRDVDGQPGKPVLVSYYTRSTNGGASFETPRRLHSLPAVDQSAFIDGGFSSAHAFATLGAAPNGTLHAVWIDTRGMQQDDAAAAAYTAISTDDGATWSTEQVALAEDVCPCCQITLAFDERSNVYLGSRQITTRGTRNSTVARAVAGSGVHSRPVPTGGKEWRLDGCPLKPTVVAVQGSRVYTAAFNGAETPAGVYFSMSADAGRRFGAATLVHPQASVSDAPALVLARGEPLLAWHAKTQGPRRVFWRSATRDGQWGAVQELEAPAGTAQYPALAARPDGRVQIVWQQGEQIMTRSIEPRAAALSAGRRP